MRSAAQKSSLVIPSEKTTHISERKPRGTGSGRGFPASTHAKQGDLQYSRRLDRSFRTRLMPSSSTYRFSQRAKNITSSTIREILKVTERPEIFSFAGGLPAPVGFPIADVKQAIDRVLTERGHSALQYGPTEGYTPLREWLAQDMQ